MIDFLKRSWLALGAFAAMTGASLHAWPRVPASLPVHWGLAGEPDRYGSRFEALWILPGIVLLLFVLLTVLPRFDANAGKNFKVIVATRSALVAGITVLHLGTVASYLGWELSQLRLVSLVVGVIFLLVGNVLPKTRPSRWIGIRLPWTYASKEAWYRAQRLGGWVMAAAGAALILTAFLTRSGVVFLGILGLMVLGMIGVSIYAYRVWKEDDDRRRAM